MDILVENRARKGFTKIIFIFWTSHSLEFMF